MLRLLRENIGIEESELFSLVRQDPILIAGVIGVTIVVVILLALLIRRLKQPPGARLLAVLSKTDAVTILMHPNPDPDAMASAIGVAQLAEQAGTPTDIRYPGEIRHPENRAFRTVLDCDFKPIESASDLDGGTVVLVDHNEPRGFEGCEQIEQSVVIDHHPGNGTGSEFTDLRSDYGACASIVAEYFDDLGVRPVSSNELDDMPEDDIELTSPISTGLLYGILADTNHLTRGCSPADFDVSAYLFPGVDEELLDRIANPEVDAEVLDVKARAIANRDVRGPFVLSNVGEVSNVDSIPQAADELLRLEGITAVIVIGEKDDTLHLSGRSRDDRVHMGEALAAVVEDIPMASAGGHARMGGGQVSILHLNGLRPQSGMTNDEFTARLFDAMDGKV